MTAPAVAAPRGNARPPRPVAVLDDILLELVDVDENIRDDVGDLDGLAASIAELGVQQPVKVTRQLDGRYKLVFGQRRVLASRQAGVLRIPAIVEPPSDVDQVGERRSIEQLSENLQRQDLNAIEEAVALRDVLDGNPKLTQAELARTLGVSPAWVSNTLRLQSLDPAVQQLIRTDAISASHGKAMANLPEKQQRDLAERVVSSKLSSHDLEREISWKQNEVESAAKKAAKTATAIPRLIAALEKAGTPKGTALLLHGSMYDIDVQGVASAVRAAGWKKAVSKYSYGPRPAGCDCATIRVEVSGRAPKLEEACANDSHRAAARHVDDSADRARRKAIESRVDLLRATIRVELEQVPIPVLMLAHGDHWSLPGLVNGWTETSNPGELRDLVAQTMASRVDASRVYNGREAQVEKALEALIAMLPPAKAAKGKKKAPA